MLNVEVGRQTIEGVRPYDLHARVAGKPPYSACQYERWLHQPIRALPVIAAEIPGVRRRLINIDPFGVGLPLYLEDEYRAMKEEDPVGPTLLHWQLILQDGCEVASSISVICNLRRLPLKRRD